MGGKGVPDEKDFEGGDVLWWDGIAVFPNASKLAKLVCELPWGAAAINKEKWKQWKGSAWSDDKPKNTHC